MKLGSENINNIRHASDTVLMPESSEDLTGLAKIVENFAKHTEYYYHGKLIVVSKNPHPIVNIAKQ